MKTDSRFRLLVTCCMALAFGFAQSDTPGPKYVEPVGPNLARLEVKNLSNFAVAVRIYASPDSCSRPSTVFYDSRRDDDQGKRIAGYKDGQPIYYKHVDMETALLSTQRSLRNVAVEAKPILMRLISQSPPDVSYQGNKQFTHKYKECDLLFSFTPEPQATISIEFGSDSQLGTCGARAQSTGLDAQGLQVVKPVTLAGRKC